MTLDELIERAKQVSQQTGDPRTMDNEVVAEILLPRVFSKLAEDITKDEYNLESLRRDHSIVFTAGVGTLPQSIKEEYADSILIPSLPRASYVPRYSDFTRLAATASYQYFTVSGNTIYLSTFPATTASVVINAVTLPIVPDDLDDDVDLKDNHIEQAIVYLSSALIGETNLKDMGSEHFNVNP